MTDNDEIKNLISGKIDEIYDKYIGHEVCDDDFLKGFLKRGKYVRPLTLTYSSAAKLGGINESIISAAAALEVAHRSTLIYDDILDSSYIRNGKPSVRSRLGDSTASVVGSLLQSVSSLELSFRFDRVVKKAIRDVQKGQLVQTGFDWKKNKVLSCVNKILRIVYLKSASLYKASIKYSYNNRESVNNLSYYVSVAYQVGNDISDLLPWLKGNDSEIPEDIKNGTPTIPIVTAVYKGLKAGDDEGICMIKNYQQFSSESIRIFFLEHFDHTLMREVINRYLSLANTEMDSLISSGPYYSKLRRMTFQRWPKQYGCFDLDKYYG